MGYDSKCEYNDIIIPPGHLQGLIWTKMLLNSRRMINIFNMENLSLVFASF